MLAGGCSKQEKPEIEKEFVPNENRGTDYEYDYINYVDVNVIGPNGYAIVELSLKDFKASDFKDEESYIAVRKLMTALEPMLRVDKSENLSNDDIILIGISTEYTGGVGDLSFNLEPYQIQIKDLKDPEPIDLFDNGSIGFYNLKGTKEFYSYVKPDSTLPVEMQENLEYSISCNEKEIVADQSILKIKVAMNQSFINEGNYKSTERYVKLQGYTAEYEAEKVLKHVVESIDFEEADTNKIVERLNLLYANGEYSTNGVSYKYDTVANIQGSKYENEFEYRVHSIWYNPLDESQELCLRDTVKMVIVDETVQIIKSSNRFNSVNMDSCYTTPNDRIEHLQLIYKTAEATDTTE